MEAIEIIGVVFAINIVGFFLAGRFTGLKEKSPATPFGRNENSDNCTFLCNQVDQRRQEKYLAESAAQASQRKVNNLRVEAAFACVVAIALATTTYVCLLIPVYGAVIAIVLGAVGVIAFLAASFIIGKLSVVMKELNASERHASKARNSEAEARTLLVNKCPEQAVTCLLHPSPGIMNIMR